MKKIISLLLASCIAVLLTGCFSEDVKLPTDKQSGIEHTSSGDTTDNSDEKGEKVTTDSCEVQLVHCIYDEDSLTATDKEYVGSSFSKIDGKVFVDLKLELKNTGYTDFTKEDISGYFMYDDLRYDMQFEVESASLTAFTSDRIVAPGQTAYVHLFDRVEKTAKDKDITVVYTINGNEYEAKVKSDSSKDALDDKIEVKVGDKVDVGESYSFEVVDFAAKNYIQAQDVANSQQYKIFGGSDMRALDLVLKIKNKTDEELKQMTVYTIVDGEVYRGECNIETNNNTEIGDLSSEGLKAGQDEYCHVYVGLKEEIVENIAIRFNIAGNCYYCELSK